MRTNTDGTPTDAASEDLAYVQMVQGDDLSWSITIVQVSVDGSAQIECTNPGQTAGAGCVVSDISTTDEYWNIAEEVVISEGSDDLCSGPSCEVTITIIDAREYRVLSELTVTVE